MNNTKIHTSFIVKFCVGMSICAIWMIFAVNAIASYKGVIPTCTGALDGPDCKALEKLLHEMDLGLTQITEFKETMLASL